MLYTIIVKERGFRKEVCFVNNVYEKMKTALLYSDKPSGFFDEIINTELLHLYFPELEKLIGVPQPEKHHQEGDVWTHTMMVLDEAAKKRNTVTNPLGFMLSALCHDYGKSVCTENINGEIHAYRHETEGLPLVMAFMERINAAVELTDYVLNMTELHMLPNMKAAANSSLKSTNKMFDKAIEPFDLIQLSICDGLGKIPQITDTEEFLVERYSYYSEIMARPFVTEADLRSAGVEHDENFDEVLSYSHKLRLAGIDKVSALKQTIAYAKKLKKLS